MYVREALFVRFFMGQYRANNETYRDMQWRRTVTCMLRLVGVPSSLLLDPLDFRGWMDHPRDPPFIHTHH